MKRKKSRIIISLKCTECLIKYTNIDRKEKLYFNYLNRKSKIEAKKKNSFKLYSYTTSKNRFNTTNRLTLKKYCPNCKRHTLYKEIK